MAEQGFLIVGDNCYCCCNCCNGQGSSMLCPCVASTELLGQVSSPGHAPSRMCPKDTSTSCSPFVSLSSPPLDCPPLSLIYAPLFLLSSPPLGDCPACHSLITHSLITAPLMLLSSLLGCCPTPLLVCVLCMSPRCVEGEKASMQPLVPNGEGASGPALPTHYLRETGHWFAFSVTFWVTFSSSHSCYPELQRQ